MRWIALIVTLGLLFGCHSEPDSLGVEGEPLEMPRSGATADSLWVSGVGYKPKAEVYRAFMTGAVSYPKVPAYVRALADTGDKGVVDSLLAYYEDQNRNAHATVLGTAVEMKSRVFARWLEASAEKLDPIEWQIISAAVQRAEWRDSTVMRVLMEQALHGEDGDVRAPVTRAFNGIGTLDEVRTLAALADTTVDESVRERALGTLLRFDVPAFNQKVRSLIDTARTLNIHLRLNMERHRRYDFLPELRAIQDRLPPSVSAHSRRQLRKLIAYLEDKKAEGAPLGVPLDWPETTWEELEREGSDANTD